MHPWEAVATTVNCSLARSSVTPIRKRHPLRSFSQNCFPTPSRPKRFSKLAPSVYCPHSMHMYADLSLLRFPCEVLSFSMWLPSHPSMAPPHVSYGRSEENNNSLLAIHVAFTFDGLPSTPASLPRVWNSSRRLELLLHPDLCQRLHIKNFLIPSSPLP